MVFILTLLPAATASAALTLHHYDFWPDSQAGRIALLELNEDFEMVTVDMSQGQHKTREFRKLNPEREPPVLVDDNDPGGHELVVWEPLGVAMYVHTRANLSSPNDTLFPTSPCNLPLTLQWAQWSAVNLTLPMERLLLHGKILPEAERNKERFDRNLQKIDRTLKILDKVALTKPGAFINREPGNAGDEGQFSIADIMIGSTLTYLRLFPEGEAVLNGHPNVKAYLETLEARPSFQAAFGGVTLPPPNQVEPIQPPP
jgi:glutathione S-transferase